VTIRLDMTPVGLDGVDRALGLMERAFDGAARRMIATGIIRPTRLPGSGGNVMLRDGFTLERQAQDAFANGGTTALRGPWTGYSGEPKYAAHKARRGGGEQVGLWLGSQAPLYRTFMLGDGDHIEVVEDDQWSWGSARWYAGTFHAGQPVTPWGETQPARHVVTLNRDMGREGARAHLRYLAGWLRQNGQSISEFRVSL
jgi:hypothetical protein